MKTNALFNVNRLVSESSGSVPVESSFMSDFDYVCRQLDNHEPHYYFSKVNKEENPEVFDVSTKSMNCWVVDKLPQPRKEILYTDTGIVYLVSGDQTYYICKYYDGKPSRTYKPSSLRCLRNMYYQVTGADVDPEGSRSSDFVGICESGTDRHKRIQHVISKMSSFGVDCEYLDIAEYVTSNNLPLKVLGKTDYETKLFDESRNLIFLCDGLIRYKGELYIIEIKTESSYKWMSRNNADESHRYQSWAYSLELGIDKVLFIYENRDVCTKKPYCIQITDEQRNQISDRISLCQGYVDSGTAPPMEATITNKDCQYCDYKTVCKKDRKKS